MTRLIVGKLARERDIDAAALSRATGIAPQNLRKILSGDVQMIRLDSLEAIAYALEVRVSDLFEGEPAAPAIVQRVIGGARAKRDAGA